MTQEIKLTTDQMRLMSLFQNVTKATARDCVEDEKLDRLIFVVNEGKMGLAIAAAVTSLVLSANFFGSCHTVIAWRSTTQKKHSYSFCRDTKFLRAPK